jgi:transcription elongation factor Elf1
VATDTKIVKTGGAGGVTFTCKLCGEVKPFEEMVVVTEYTPAIIVCKACAKAIRK